MDMPAHPDVTAALEDVERILEAEGAIVKTVTLPKLSEFAGINRVILCSEAWSIHATWLRERPGDYGALARRRLLPGAFMIRRRLCRRATPPRRTDRHGQRQTARFRRADVRQFMDPASEIDDAAETSRTYPRQARAPFNVTGHPALAMMSGCPAMDCRFRCNSSAGTLKMRRCCRLPRRMNGQRDGTRSIRRSDNAA